MYLVFTPFWRPMLAAFITGAAIEVSGGKLCVQDIGAPWGKQI